MQHHHSPEPSRDLTPEQREARRRQVLNTMAALAKDPDHGRQMFRAKVGGQLAALVARAGVSAAKLARKLNISPSQLSRQLGGDANLTLNSLHDIANAAGATVRLQFEPVHHQGPGAGLQEGIARLQHHTPQLESALTGLQTSLEAGGMRMWLAQRQIRNQLDEVIYMSASCDQPELSDAAANESVLPEIRLTLRTA